MAIWRLGIFILAFILCGCFEAKTKSAQVTSVDALLAEVAEGPLKTELIYGRDLIFETSKWIGPQGKVKAYTGNRMACKSCHLDGGIRDFGLSMKDTHGLYPQYRSREGKILNLAERINNCVENPMLGVALPENSRINIASTFHRNMSLRRITAQNYTNFYFIGCRFARMIYFRI